MRRQIDAVYDSGLDEWILWNPGSNYTVEALADADGNPPAFAAPAPAPQPAAAVDTARRDSASGITSTVRRDTVR